MSEIHMTIAELLRRQEALDEEIVALDEKIQAVLVAQQTAIWPNYQILCVRLNTLYIALGNAMYSLGGVNARLDDAEFSGRSETPRLQSGSTGEPCATASRTRLEMRKARAAQYPD